MKKLSQMNSYELRDYAEFLGAEKKRLYGTGNNALRIIISGLESKQSDGKVWYVICNGEQVFLGNKPQCEYTVATDLTGKFELYSE